MTALSPVLSTSTRKADVVYDSLNTGATYGGPAVTCNTTYCHSSGKGLPGTSVTWNTGASLGCNGCHGTSNAFGRPDNGTPTATSSMLMLQLIA